jgi:hypothetical protein
MGTRKINTKVVWPEGKPLDWQIVPTGEALPVPEWRDKAKALHIQGRSIREISAAVGKCKSEVHRVVSGAKG